MVGGHYHDKIGSSSVQGKCAFDIEKSLHIRDPSQNNRRKGTSLTSGGSYWDSSTWTYLEFEPKHSEDNCETSNAETRFAKHTKWTFYGDNLQAFSLLCCSRVTVKLALDMLHI